MEILFLLFFVTGTQTIPIPWYNSYLFEATLQELDNNQGNIYLHYSNLKNISNIIY